MPGTDLTGAPRLDRGARGAQASRGPKGSSMYCYGDPLPRATHALEFGATIEVGGYDCLSTKSGMRCDLTDGHGGFIVAQDEISDH